MTDELNKKLLKCPYCFGLRDFNEYTDPEIKANKVYRYFMCKTCGNTFVAIGLIQGYNVEKDE